ncbi:MAG: hypothetical protein QHH07_01500 [Sedimentisphaerales bacterium]|jgi:hypothetical protein|nr:hypothetical protein [Sedimentisphaerales bacterium]
MIRTLCITSVVAGLLAVGLMVLLSMYGVKPDQETVRLLAAPSIIEQFKDRPATQPRTEVVSVLEELANGLARLINPPAPAPAQGQPRTGPTNIALPATRPRPSAKFKLLATSFHPTDPNLSRALIELDTIDRKQVWVRVGQTIEHYTITEIRDGAILYGGPDNVQLVQVEARPPKVSLLAGSGPKPRQAASPSQPMASASSNRPRPSVPARTAPRPSNPNLPTATRPQPEQYIRDVEQMAERLRTEQAQLDDPEKQKIQQEVLEQLSQYIQAARLSQEANASGQLPGDTNLPELDPNLIQ